MLDRIYQWAFLYDQEPFEVFSIFLKILNGLLFLGINSERTSKSIVLTSMKSIAPLWIWGTLTLCVASFHIYAMFQSRWVIRKIALMGAIIYWMFFFLIYYLNGATGVVILMLPALSIFMCWAYLRLALVERAQDRVKHYV